MRKALSQKVKRIRNIEEILSLTIAHIRSVKDQYPKVRIAYVSGKVTLDGKKNIKKNLTRLHRYTRRVTQIFGEYVFSCADIFTDDTYWKSNLPNPVHQQDFYKFYRQILKNGVTDIFMTPGWEKSIGARDEHKTAKEIGLTVHYLK